MFKVSKFPVDLVPFSFLLISELFAVSEGAVRKFSDLSESLLQLHQAYVSLLTSMFSFLSSSTLDYVCEKLRSTIFQCGFTPLANDIISSFFGNESLFTSFIHPLLSNQRYSSKFIAVRKLLRSILTAASPSHVEKLFVFTEKTILRKQIQAALATGLLKEKLFDFSEAHSCFERFYESYNASQRLVSKEVIGSNERLLCAADRVLMRETSSFDTSQSLLFSKILSYCLFSLLVSSPTYLDTHGDYYVTNGVVEKVGKILWVRNRLYLISFIFILFRCWIMKRLLYTCILLSKTSFGGNCSTLTNRAVALN
jgi:hypothetical protein